MNTELSDVKKNMLKTGTTILGMQCKDGIVMASDRRVTAGGSLVVNKNIRKTIPITESTLMCISGSASDAKMLAKVAAAEIKLKELKTKEKSSVKEVANLIATMSYRNIRTPSMIPSIVGSIIGGVNEDGSTELFTIEPAGGIDEVQDYDANFSSGMPYVLGLLERQWKKDMTMEEGIELAQEALKASTQRDTASGNGMDVFAITKDGVKHVVSKEITPNYN